ncbi:MAG: tRNA adenosine(34) deaminase TadA [Smithellaceae bacterium]|nr:tRNA adenosine(34) deaminase TadA [Smithellaceae bacterium]
MDIDVEFMRVALAEAREALTAGEVPVGALLVMGGEVVSRAHNSPIALTDPSAHAEILAIREASARKGNYRLTGATLYVTLEPCLMCVGAIIHARIERLVFGASDPKGGAVVSLYQVGCDRRLNHIFQVRGGVLEADSAGLLKDFFRGKRDLSSSNISDCGGVPKRP